MRDTQFLSAEAFELAEAEGAAKLAQRHADFVAWLADQPESFRNLASKWFDLQTERKMPPGFSATIFRDRRGRLVYEVSCANGVHQSHESFEHALELLIDSHRPRVEDLEATHLRMQAWSGDVDIKGARRLCDGLAKDVRALNPGLTGEEYDALFEEALSMREQMKAEDAKGEPVRRGAYLLG